MPFIINPPEEGKKFSTLNPNYEKESWSWNTLASTLEFSELRFAINDDFYFIYAMADKLTDFKNFKDMKAPWIPTLVTFPVARKDYEQYSKAAGKKVTVAQSRLEKVVCLLLEALDPTKSYSGELYLMDTNTLDQILTKTDKKGQPMSDEKVAGLLETCGSFEEVEAPEKIVDADVICPAQKARSGGFGTTVNMQPELEKLNDRIKFIASQIAQGTDLKLCTNVFELRSLILSQPEAMEIYQFCIELMK